MMNQRRGIYVENLTPKMKKIIEEAWNNGGRTPCVMVDIRTANALRNRGVLAIITQKIGRYRIAMFTLTSGARAWLKKMKKENLPSSRQWEDAILERLAKKKSGAWRE